jgi:hypothetical protein
MRFWSLSSRNTCHQGRSAKEADSAIVGALRKFSGVLTHGRKKFGPTAQPETRRAAMTRREMCLTQEPSAKVFFTLRYLRVNGLLKFQCGGFPLSVNGLLQFQRVGFPFVVSEVSPALAWQSVRQETVPTMWVLFLERYRRVKRTLG